MKELIGGKGIEHPSNVAAVDETFKKAPESKKKQGHQQQSGAARPRGGAAPKRPRHTARMAGPSEALYAENSELPSFRVIGNPAQRVSSKNTNLPEEAYFGGWEAEEPRGVPGCHSGAGEGVGLSPPCTTRGKSQP